MSFLKAEWRKLILANYEVDPERLRPFLPHKTELDFWNGRCYVSMVGFKFVDVKMLGFRIPFHVNFEEVNLRFYVRYRDGKNRKRGVVFIKEIVPKPAITFFANTLYQEHYETRPMKHEWDLSGDQMHIAYHWQVGDTWQKMAVHAKKGALEILPGSEAEFITEHYWGYTKIKDDKTYEYEVTHPRWQQYPIVDHEMDIDFGLNYGDAFRDLNERTPLSVMLAEGSLITVEHKKTLR